MIYLDLFLTFFKIGLFTFGGGYGMIAIIQQEMATKGWIDPDMLYNFIGISETTPGPIAINMATFVGSAVGRSAGSAFLGAFLATLGVVLPSLIIILLIAALFKTFLKNKYVSKILDGIKPVVVGLILATGAMLVLKNLGISLGNTEFDHLSLIIMAIVATASIVYKRLTKKDLSPIIMIVGSACLGMLFYSL